MPTTQTFQLSGLNFWALFSIKKILVTTIHKLSEHSHSPDFGYNFQLGTTAKVISRLV